MKKAIIVNATAARESGARSILDQFISNIPAGFEYVIFVDPSYDTDTNENIQLVKIDTTTWFKRIKWDWHGINRWIKQHQIDPIAAVSLQNTAFRLKKSIPQFIYFHQAIPFYENAWNPLKKSQLKLWLYKHIYPFFIKATLNTNVTVFVQLDYIKQGFSQLFRHPKEKIRVFSPTINKSNSIETIDLPSDTINLFYPATAHFYKNHATILDALQLVSHPAVLYTTIPETVSFAPDHTGLTVNLGKVSYDEIFTWYNSVDALVYPSYLESFGLPLIEAAMVGLPIIASDLPYAREALNGYPGAQFVPFDNPNEWAEAINNIEKGKRFPQLNISNRPGWVELFHTIHSSI